MRLWSLHPQYLDTKGLLAVWREGLLAKHVLEGKTKGYRNHPQMERFKSSRNPIDAIMQYLYGILSESLQRGYHFDATKIAKPEKLVTMIVTTGQIEHERKHLLNKLENRDPKAAEKLRMVKRVDLHPMFILVSGDVETWEKRR